MFKSPSTGQRFVRAGFAGKNGPQDFVVMPLDRSGTVADARIIHIEGKIEGVAVNKNKMEFNGRIESSSLRRADKRNWNNP